MGKTKVVTRVVRVSEETEKRLDHLRGLTGYGERQSEAEARELVVEWLVRHMVENFARAARVTKESKGRTQP